jgi:hypothetical protein
MLLLSMTLAVIATIPKNIIPLSWQGGNESCILVMSFA